MSTLSTLTLTTHNGPRTKTVSQRTPTPASEAEVRAEDIAPESRQGGDEGEGER